MIIPEIKVGLKLKFFTFKNSGLVFPIWFEALTRCHSLKLD